MASKYDALNEATRLAYARLTGTSPRRDKDPFAHADDERVGAATKPGLVTDESSAQQKERRRT